ncbi:DUF2508 family protein [Anaeromicrobium sediminis]|uniref:DUF2508 domain-containing protein n=1 Tax=Anaeromicrobium sediminis TaxID=1478221 RepID=A0A267MDS4_9FIRM|nr:DUF2508 family protein [Anaeromicrobium sediminis]PAB57015.1 hypothetical protein CCE28_19730 [Anaeromicrobium sediminis]
MQEAVKNIKRSEKVKKNNFLNSINNIYSQLLTGQEVKSEADKMLDNIRLAHDEWGNAENFFQNATDPDLIDHAIFRMEAARTKYIYLMRLAREMGIYIEL